ncbi:MAG: tRNA pseudouridine(38-40) synthase TruA [Saprospiraceae bacterium]|nr:tRNA pseudouridine(38-40) synthase TruA [Saprospiraceae bacterium]MCB0542041.1 tRNA pseudouridine(38-40) synthase TruA [Saprospiraceae bacterium]MCB0576729.1 tRNA pseudouridine(38-40) synthase TruA [Saprospiraceae bacterium]MCB9305628.1 tRNA pseudouridine(38-40) synthase TruA [Lewinellaceae bacterium]MCB9354127.1 tRNA pseudouridine(38-40) synthase TruA [Lewinellaceae bacterium]
MRYFITLSYLGTRYKGWQLQPNAPSVQATIEEALQTLLRREVPLTGCGRTDTGVHARFYVAHFDSEKPLPARFVAGMNGLLPPDIAIHSFREVAPDAHARFDAYERSYEYHIGFRKDPFSTETALFYPQYHRLDIEKMQEAAATLLEYDAFFPFCKTHSGVDHYHCKLTQARWELLPEAHRLVFYISANRFLRGMVRLIVGACLHAGLGQLQIADIKEALDRQAALKKSLSVQARGLFLTDVKYPY